MSQLSTQDPAASNLACTTQAPPEGQNLCPDGCTHCNTPLKSGLKYQGICTTCNPNYLQRCGGCQRQLWDCMCIKPHTWE